MCTLKITLTLVSTHKLGWNVLNNIEGNGDSDKIMLLRECDLSFASFIH